MRVLTQQPQGKTTVDHTTKLGKDITFLWSGADRANDSAGNIFVGAGVNAQIITTSTSDRGRTLTTDSTGSISWRLYDIQPTSYVNYLGPFRSSSGSWSQGIVFKYRNASTSTEMFMVTNNGSWNHSIYVDASGFVKVRNPSWTAGVFITSDSALTLGDWVSVVVVWQSGNTRFYVNGVLQAETNTQNIYIAGLERVHFTPVGTDILTAFTARVGWTSADVLSWHNNPWQLFKAQTSTYEKLTSKLVFDVPQAITRSSYVQTANMPRKPVPVNSAHPLARGIKFASGPVWGDRDAVDPRIKYSEIPGYRQMTRFGEAFLPGKTAFSQSVSNIAIGGSFSHTTMVVGCIEQDTYPDNTTTYGDRLGVDWDDNNSFQLRIDVNGRLKVGIQNNAGQPRYLTGSLELFPLRKLGVAISVVEAGVGTTLYINGKYAGFSTNAPGTTGGGVIRRVGYAIPNENSYGKQYLACGWHRALSPTEVQQISENPWQIFQQQARIQDKLLYSFIPDLNEIVNEPAIPAVSAGSRQFGGLATINLGNSLGRSATFLWSAANPRHDATGNFLATGIVNTTTASGATITYEPPVITPSDKGSIYTSTATPIGSGTGGGIVFSAIPASNAFRTPNRNWTVAILAKYTSSSQNLRLLQVVNAAQSTQHLYGTSLGGNIFFRSSSSYLHADDITTKTTPYTLDQVHLTVFVVSSGSTRLYVDGKLVAETANNHVDGIQIARLAITTASMQPILVSAFDKALSRQEVRQLTSNPWQLYRQPRIRDQLLHTFTSDFTAELAPPSRVRSTYLTTPSSSDKNNAITSQLLFASSPAHGNTDGVNPNTVWTTNTGIQVIPGRGGLAWVYGRAHESQSSGLSKKLSNTQWTLFSVLSLEIDHLSQMTAGHIFAGPGFGGTVTPRLTINSDGKIQLLTLNNSISVDGVTITPRKVMVVAVTSDNTNTRFYLNGKLVHTSATVFNTGGSITYQPERISLSDSVAGTGLRPWYTYLSAAWERPLQEHEIAKLSQDPYQLFKRPDTTNHKILTGQYKYVETDANGRWIPYTEQSAYVNSVKLPRSYVPVNKAHPLADRMLYCTTPAHGTRDAYHQDMEWEGNTGIDFAYSYNIGTFSRYGLAWRMKSYSFRRSYYFTKLPIPTPRLQLTSYTMMQFLSIEQDTYPIQDGDRGLMGAGFANNLHLRLSKWGNIFLDYTYFNRAVRSFPGVAKVPLRKLVAVAVSVTPSDVSLYMDGKLVGYSNTMNSTLLPFDIRDTTSSGGAYVNALGNHAYPQNHNTIFVYFSATWRRALNASEVLEMSRNPGQIFQQPSKFKNRYAEAVQTVLDISRKFLLFFG